MSERQSSILCAPSIPKSPSPPPSPLLPLCSLPVETCSYCGEVAAETLTQIQMLRTDMKGLIDTHACHMHILEEWMKSRSGDHTAEAPRSLHRGHSSDTHARAPTRDTHTLDLISLHPKGSIFKPETDMDEGNNGTVGKSETEETPSVPVWSSHGTSGFSPSSQAQSSKLKHILKHANSYTDPVSQSAKLMRKRSQTLMQAVVRSSAFETLSLVLVLSNAVIVSVEVQVKALNQETMQGKDLIDTGFCVAFSFELLLRVVAEGSKFIRKAWNVLDFIIVFFMLLEKLMDSLTKNGSAVIGKLSVLRVLRFVRIVRVLRVVRVLKFFSELRVMLLSIIGSLRSLFWASSVLALVFYIFGIIFTQGVIDHCETTGTWEGDAIDVLRLRFGSLEKSVLALFEAMSGGISWGELVDALHPLHFMYTGLFLCFITLAVFAIVNIVTGVFVENAIQNSRHDRDLVIQNQLKNTASHQKHVAHLFAEMDTNRDGRIGVEEFYVAMEDERLVAFFNSLGIDSCEAHILFGMLDRDHQGEIDIDEFFQGCNRLRGTAKSMDMEKLLYSCQWMMHSMARIEDSLLDRG